MQFILIVSVSLAVILQLVLTCPPEAETLNYLSELRSADIVFRGVPTSTVGEILDRHGMVTIRWQVNAEEYFKDNIGQREDSINIFRRYYQEYPCNMPIFSEPSESYLIFSSAANFMGVRCDFDIPWNCVPESAKTLLRNSC